MNNDADYRLFKTDETEQEAILGNLQRNGFNVIPVPDMDGSHIAVKNGFRWCGKTGRIMKCAARKLGVELDGRGWILVLGQYDRTDVYNDMLKAAEYIKTEVADCSLRNATLWQLVNALQYALGQKGIL